MNTSGIRATQLADLIRDHLAQWIQRDTAGVFVTITQVTISVDKKRATAWVTVYPTKEEAKTLRILAEKARRYSTQLRSSLRRHTSPSLTFALDTAAEDEARISELLN